MADFKVDFPKSADHKHVNRAERELRRDHGNVKVRREGHSIVAKDVNPKGTFNRAEKSIANINRTVPKATKATGTVVLGKKELG